MIRFALGLASVAFWPALPSVWGLAALLVSAILGLFCTPLRPLIPLVFGVCWGLGWGLWSLEHRLPLAWEGRDLEARGTVVGLPREEGGRRTVAGVAAG